MPALPVPEGSNPSLLDWIKSDPLNDRNLAYLFEQLENPLGVLPFVGAGVSVPLGFPGWTEFLKLEAARHGLKEAVAHQLERNEFEEAAEFLKNRIGSGEFEDALESAFGERKVPKEFPQDSAVVEITKLSVGPVITTNFDRVLERAFETAGQPFRDKVWGSSAADQLTLAILQDRHVLVKMHGDILDRHNRVLTLTEYRAHYGDGETPDFNRPLPRLLRRLFESRPLLFIGCSLHHDRTLRILKEVANETRSHHYAVVEHPATEEELNTRKQYLSDHWLRCIWFPHRRFESVPLLLRDLARSREKAAAKPTSVRLYPTSSETSAKASAGATTQASSDFFSHRAKADSWKDMAWDYAVHEHLGETLTYFLVKIKPYRRAQAVNALNKLNSEQRLGSVRAFELLGSLDLLVRAWLPGGFSPRFAKMLENQIGGCKGVYPFSVDEVVHRWYHSPLDDRDARRRTDLLHNLDRRFIESVENGTNPAAYGEVQELNLAFRPRPEDDGCITFFEAINFEQSLSSEAMQTVCRELKEFLTKSERYRRISIDRGYGFCQILVKGESQNFFDIGKLPPDISGGFGSYGVMTETFLSHSLSYIAGEGKIGVATFAVLGGLDLFVQSILPELYPKITETHGDVELFLKGSTRAHEVGQGGRNFLHDYLLGVLHSIPAESNSVLYRLFAEWEQYFRENHGAFLERRSLNLGSLARAAGIPREKSWKDFTLVDILQVCWQGLKDSPDGKLIGGDWEQLTTVRNAVMHYKTEELAAWQAIVRILLEHWRRVISLICMIERQTGVPFTGLYRERCV